MMARVYAKSLSAKSREEKHPNGDLTKASEYPTYHSPKLLESRKFRRFPFQSLKTQYIEFWCVFFLGLWPFLHPYSSNTQHVAYIDYTHI